MPKPEKNTVLKWYKELKTQLLKEGIDVNNPKDLMRVKSYYFYKKNNPFYPGILNEQVGEKKFAFIPRKPGKQGLMADYFEKEVPRPPEGMQTELQNRYMEQKTAREGYSNYLKMLLNAYIKGENEDTVRGLKDKVEEYKEKERVNFKAYNEKMQEAFRDYNEWIIKNQKTYDEEADYEQIEELYKQAEQGLLYFDAVNGEPRDFKQILVTTTGEPYITDSALDQKYTLVSPEGIFNDKIHGSEKVEEYEKKYGEIDYPKTLEEMYPDEPEHVAKPGVWSWIKRIVTFGINKSDFTKYDRHQERLAALEDHNRQCYETVFANYDQEIKDQYPENVVNPAKTAANRHYLSVDDFTPKVEADPERGIYNTTLQICEMNNLTYLQIEAHENPDSFDNEGKRIEEKSNLYWKNKGTIYNPENEIKFKVEKDKIEKEIPKWREKLAQKEINKGYKEIFSKDKYKETLIEEGEKGLKKYFPNAKKEDAWLKFDFDLLTEKIGQFYGGGKKEGLNVLYGILTMNQTLDKEGTPLQTPPELNEKVAMGLDALIKCANNPELKDNEKYSIVLEAGKQFTKKITHVSRTLESAASLYNDELPGIPREIDVESVKAVSAMIASKITEKGKYFPNIRKGFDDVRISKEEDIKQLAVIGNYVRGAQKGLFKIPEEKLLENEVPELKAKHNLELGL